MRELARKSEGEKEWALQPCHRCGGTGVYRYATSAGKAGGTCFRCGGDGATPKDWRRVDAAAQRRRQRDAERRARKREQQRQARLAKKWAANQPAMEADPVTVARLAGYNGDSSFLAELAGKLDTVGLTATQLDAAAQAMDREAARAAEEAAAEPCPEGRIAIAGRVLSAKVKVGYMGEPTVKLVIRDDRGFKVWGTAPKGIGHSLPNEGGIMDFVAEGGTVRIALTATVTPSPDDPGFGFYKRPAKAEAYAGRRVPEAVVTEGSHDAP